MTNLRRFEVTVPISTIAQGENVYPVEDGEVLLPEGERWYNDMLASGVLVPREIVEEDQEPDAEDENDLTPLAEADARLADLLYRAGYHSMDELDQASDEDLLEVSGVGKASVEKVREVLDGLHDG